MLPILPTWIHTSAAPGVFDTANAVIADAVAAIKGAVVLGALIYVCWVLFGRRGLAAVISAAFVAALATWLVVFDGVETIARMLGVTLS